MSKKAKTILAVVLLVLMITAAVLAYLHFAPTGVNGDKLLSISIVHGDGSEKKLTISTDSENLRGALEQEGLISGSESQYGLFVTTVDGEAADDSQQQWWCFTKGGETMTTGVDDTMIADGESYEIVLTTGYDF